MKYLLVSDIHGSFESATILIDKFIGNNCDKIAILGDILYHGPRNDLPQFYNPKKVIELLNQYSDNIIAVKGNCDAEVDQMVLNFKINDDYILNKNIYLTHGHHINYQNPLKNKDIKVVLYGHSHIIRKDIVEDKVYINLGSITIPKENCKRCYGILENNTIYIYDIEDNLLLLVEI